MIRKTIMGLLVLATLGTVVLWAFAFFGGPYRTVWDPTDSTLLMLWLSPEGCEVSLTRFYLPPDWHPTPTTLGFGWNHYVNATTRGSGYKWNAVWPSWALLLLGGLLGTYPGVVFLRRPFRQARRLRNGWCLSCGYDLQGNVSGVCPECGKATSTAT